MCTCVIFNTINKSVSAVSTELQNSVEHTFTLYVKVDIRLFSRLNAVDKYLIRLFTDKLKRSCWRLSNRHSVGNVERLRLSTSPVRCCRCQTEHTPLVLTKRYCTTIRNSDMSLTLRLSQPVVVYTLSLTSRLRPRAAVFHTSTMPRSPDCRVDACLPSTTTSLCRHRPRASYAVWLYAAYIFSCLLIFLNSCWYSHLPGQWRIQGAGGGRPPLAWPIFA